MKLSEAIREGIKARPEQAFGRYFQGANGSCALGAAYDGLGGCARAEWTPETVVEGFISRATGAEMFEIKIKCPKCKKTDVTAQSMARSIAHMNDDHKMTREDIASFLEAKGY